MKDSMQLLATRTLLAENQSKPIFQPNLTFKLVLHLLARQDFESKGPFLRHTVLKLHLQRNSLSQDCNKISCSEI